MCIAFFYESAYAQKNNSNSSGGKKHVVAPDRLFENDDILHFKLTGKLIPLFNDRKNNMTYHPMLLQYKIKDTGVALIRLMVKTRGHFRRLAENCKMPPLMLSFPKNDKMKGSPFENQNKLKLVVPCKGDEFVVREWLVYKLYNLVTDKSFKVKLVQVEFEDSLQKRSTEIHYCILLEDEKKLADRNRCFVWNRKMRPMQSMDKKQFTMMAVFQYMIGNADWSVPYLQNIKLIAADSLKSPFAVPYDFDHAGIVEAPYARAVEELGISSTRERIYRGYCENDKKLFAETFELFNKLKDNFYQVYTSCPLLSSKYIKATTKFLDDFYRIINSNKSTESEFGKPCRTDVRIEIKGLKE